MVMFQYKQKEHWVDMYPHSKKPVQTCFLDNQNILFINVLREAKQSCLNMFQEKQKHCMDVILRQTKKPEYMGFFL